MKVHQLMRGKIYIKTLVQFLKFGAVGLLNTFVHYCIYLLCTTVGINYLISNFGAFTVSILNSFYWNNKYVFIENSKKRNWIRVLIRTYIAYSLTGILLNSLLLWVEIEKLNISEIIAPIINLIFTIPLNYIINKFWAYRETNKFGE